MINYIFSNSKLLNNVDSFGNIYNFINSNHTTSYNLEINKNFV